MQGMLPITCRELVNSQEQTKVDEVICKLSYFLNTPCGKILDLDELDKLEY